jgi:hypothetical protein
MMGTIPIPSPVSPLRSVPDPSEWGSVVQVESMMGNVGLAEAMESVDRLLRRMREDVVGDPVIMVEPDHGDPAATGFRDRNGGTIVHRYDGFSKATRPVDPFDPESRSDNMIRGLVESDWQLERAPVRCVIEWDDEPGGPFVTDRVVISSHRGIVPFAPGTDARRRMEILLLSARSCLEAAASPPSTTLHEDAQAQMARLLEGAEDVHTNRSAHMRVCFPSPIGRSLVKTTWRPALRDDILPTLLLPTACSYVASRTSGGKGTEISISPLRMETLHSNFTPMDILDGLRRAEGMLEDPNVERA